MVRANSPIARASDSKLDAGSRSADCPRKRGMIFRRREKKSASIRFTLREKCGCLARRLWRGEVFAVCAAIPAQAERNSGFVLQHRAQFFRLARIQCGRRSGLRARCIRAGGGVRCGAGCIRVEIERKLLHLAAQWPFRGETMPRISSSDRRRHSARPKNNAWIGAAPRAGAEEAVTDVACVMKIPRTFGD